MPTTIENAGPFAGWQALPPFGCVLPVTPDFAGKKPGKPAEDLSGIDCLPPAADGSRTCVVVNDESQSAQKVRVTGDGAMHPCADPLALFGSVPVGTPPARVAAAFDGTFKGEFDGEGVAFARDPVNGGGTFYLIGSHGLGRKAGKLRPTSFLLARVPMSADGQTGPVTLSWRVSNVLMQPARLGPFFARPLDVDNNGLNIEGIAVVGDRLLLGLRAPSLDGNCFIVETSVAAMFLPGSAPADAPAAVFAVPAGHGVGIRDLTALRDGSLLALFGPAHGDDNVPYAIARLRLERDTMTARITPVGRVPDAVVGGTRGKAEAVVLLGCTGDQARLLVLCDGIANGAPREFRVKLPA